MLCGQYLNLMYVEPGSVSSNHYDLNKQIFSKNLEEGNTEFCSRQGRYFLMFYRVLELKHF
jgi:hypothetical protein